MKFCELIDTAIGSPNPGHVNFSALHCLLNCIADKLGISEDDVNFSCKDTKTHCSWYKLSECKYRKHYWTYLKMIMLKFY